MSPARRPRVRARRSPPGDRRSLPAELALREIEPLPDLTRALRRPLAQPPLELLDRSGHEDRHSRGDLLRDVERTFGLKLEHRDPALGGDAVDLGAERAVALPGNVRDVLEEVAARDAVRELPVREEVVVAPVLLPASLKPRRGRDGELEVGDALEERADECSLPGPGRASDDDHRESTTRRPRVRVPVEEADKLRPLPIRETAHGLRLGILHWLR